MFCPFACDGSYLFRQCRQALQRAVVIWYESLDYQIARRGTAGIISKLFTLDKIAGHVNRHGVDESHCCMLVHLKVQIKWLDVHKPFTK